LSTDENSTEGETIALIDLVFAQNGQGVPSGTAEFFVDGQSLATVPLDEYGQAVFVWHPQAGTYVITAEYTPDTPNFNPSVSDSFTQTVAPPP
jgi:hypothetical protein